MPTETEQVLFSLRCGVATEVHVGREMKEVRGRGGVMIGLYTVICVMVYPLSTGR